ncbi:MAG: sugar-binding domain-containing protein [Clostridium sp.]
MYEIIKLQQRIVPEVEELFNRRYTILRTILYNQPIGRRILATNLDLGERTIRNEITFLKEKNLVEVFSEGMYVTKDGEDIIEDLAELLKQFKGINEVEEEIRIHLNLNKVIIVPGDYDKDKTVIHEIGKMASAYFSEVLEKDSTIAITGGRTIKEFVDNFPTLKKYNDVVVLPARGGMGKYMETQANTLAARLSDKIGGSHRLLHVLDSLSDEILESIMREKSIEEVVSMIRNSDFLIYGVGRADIQAERREVEDSVMRELSEKQAVGEALGNYYNIEGHIVYKHSTVGVRDEDARRLNKTIAVAAGSSKAEAIIATQLNRPNGVLITDEGAAMEILKFIKDNK